MKEVEAGQSVVSDGASRPNRVQCRGGREGPR